MLSRATILARKNPTVPLRALHDHLIARVQHIAIGGHVHERVDRRPWIVALVVAEDDDAMRLQQHPRAHGVFQHVRRAMRAVDVHAVVGIERRRPQDLP